MKEKNIIHNYITCGTTYNCFRNAKKKYPSLLFFYFPFNMNRDSLQESFPITWISLDVKLYLEQKEEEKQIPEREAKP